MAPVLALAGFMGSGKSAVGMALSVKVGRPYVDLDQEVERDLGVSIHDFFIRNGEQAFRTREAKVLRETLARHVGSNVVLSLGGGTLIDEMNREALRVGATVVYLEVSEREAWTRAADSDRPLAQDHVTFAELLHARRPVYEQCADWFIPTGGREVFEVVDDVEQLVARQCDTRPGTWARILAHTSRKSMILGGPRALECLAGRAQGSTGVPRCLRVITDDNVMEACGETVLAALGVGDKRDVLVVGSGEQSKSPTVLQECWEWLASRKTRREDVVVALGGGVVGDLAGFAAATYQRGIGLWQIPTSLLAQVDSSVGGKTAVNLSTAKNLVGAFYQPDLVVVDPSLLATLPDREYTGALGEVVKHALLSSEREFQTLERWVQEIVARDAAVLSELVKRSVWYKSSVVEADEKERDQRAVLNLGHTVGHGLESALGYGSVSHGQAVALGLVVALVVSEELLGLDGAVRSRTTALLDRLGVDTSVSIPSVEAVLQATQLDKKKSHGSSGFVGLRAIGEPVVGLDVSVEALERAMKAITR